MKGSFSGSAPDACKIMLAACLLCKDKVRWPARKSPEPVVALHFAWYNYVRIHRTLRVTPAMEARITYRLWTIEDLLTWSPN